MKEYKMYIFSYLADERKIFMEKKIIENHNTFTPIIAYI
jgi:hypothetical protein